MLSVILDAAVIMADPIIQGLAIALMVGELASLLISRMAGTIRYYAFNHHSQLNPGHNSAKGDADHGADPRIGREGAGS